VNAARLIRHVANKVKPLMIRREYKSLMVCCQPLVVITQTRNKKVSYRKQDALSIV